MSAALTAPPHASRAPPPPPPKNLQNEGIPLADLAHDLGQRADALCRWLGLAGRVQGRTLLALNPVRGDRLPGSFRIELHGSKAGLWIDWATGDRFSAEAGDALDLIAYIRGVPLGEAARLARQFLGLPEGAIPGPRLAATETRPDLSEAEKSRRAQAMWLTAQASLAGTPVADYLAGRGINLAELGRQPRALRYHPALWCADLDCILPAMVAAVNRGTEHVATHRTWLQRINGRWGRARLAGGVVIDKKSFGPISGGHIAIARGASGKPLRQAPDGETVAIAEGIETALSVAVACPELRVLSGLSLGGMGSVALPPSVSTVILCGDNDPGKWAMRMRRAAERYQAEGRTVRVAVPEVAGADWNDVLVSAEV